MFFLTKKTIILGCSKSDHIKPLIYICEQICGHHVRTLFYMKDTMKKVGIIGGGAAGLAAAKHVLQTGKFQPIIWEQTNEIGGTWAYTPNTGTDQYGLPIHSSMYGNLRTNLAKEVMGFTDFPFPESSESFIPHAEVLSYLHKYCQHFSVEPCIKLLHHVENVAPVKESVEEKWNITVRNLENNQISTESCDYVIVCNGHYSDPDVPFIPGIEKFKGKQLHSHSYRNPEEFSGENVVLLGGGVSGIDISLEVSRCAKQVVLSHYRVPLEPTEKPNNWVQKKAIVSAHEDGFTLSDGEVIKMDTIMYCTGYQYTFPFLSEECKIKLKNRRVHTLYKHMINTEIPSMAFIGIPFLVCPFLLFDFQAGYIAQHFLGNLTLPLKSDMVKSVNDEYELKMKSGIEEKNFHKLGPEQWKYFEDLCEEANMPKVQPAVPAIFNYVHTIRNKRLLTYRSTKYKITGPDTFEKCDPLLA